MQVFEYFKDKELFCKCGCKALPGWDAVEALYVLRIMYGRKIDIRSAARCRTHNREVGGKDNSRHITDDIRQGNAFDISVPPVDEVEVIRLAIAAGFTGIGVKNNDFIHIDRRSKPAFWTY